MTGPEHFRAAIDMLNGVGAEQKRGKLITIADAIAAAQVHATLALAAATIDAAYGNLSVTTDEAWVEARSDRG